MRTTIYRNPASVHRVHRPRRVAALAVFGATLVTLAVEVPALAAGISSRPYTGKTAQGLRVSLGKPVRGGRWFTYQARMTCNDGSTFLDNPFGDLVALRKGRFHVRFKSDGGATLTDVSGTVKGKRASGTVKITEHYSSTANAQNNFPLDPHGTVICQSGPVRWTARAR